MTTVTVEGAPARADARALARFRCAAVVACVAVYLLIWVGGLVRVSGAGLGCPDWPRCFGRFLPPTDVSQVPPEIDPALFNVTLAWIEYINRLIGVTVGLLVLGAAVLALKDHRREPGLVWPTVTAALLTAFQGWLGARVVSSLLAPLVVTAHMVLALLIASLLVWAAVRAFVLEHPEDGHAARYPRGMHSLLIVLWLFALFQVGLGTHLRGTLEALLDAFPLLGDRARIWRSGLPAHLHLALGVAFVALAVWASLYILRRSQRPSWLVAFGAWSCLVLAGLLGLMGLAFVGLGIPPTVQLFHAWVASLFIGALLVLYAGSREARRASSANGGYHSLR